MVHLVRCFCWKYHPTNYFNHTVYSSSQGQLVQSYLWHHKKLLQHLFNAFEKIHKVGTFLKFDSIFNMHACYTPSWILLSKFDPTSNRLDFLPSLSTSCDFTQITPYLDGILNTMLCPFMITLFLVMKSTPKAHYTLSKFFYQVHLSSPIHQLKRHVSCPQHGWMEESQSQNAPPWVPWANSLTWVPSNWHLHELWMNGRPCVQLTWNLLINKFSFQENEISFSLDKVNG